MLKLNLGCGLNRLGPDWVNVDKFAAASPDECRDLEVFPWPWETGSVAEVVFNHSLEHMGGDAKVFLGLMQELYRVCTPGAKVQVNAPHPRHDDFINDPTHVRIVTPELLGLFSQANCRRWAQMGAANSPLALYTGVDFEVTRIKLELDPAWSHLRTEGDIDTLEQAERSQNNVVKEYRITLKVIK